MRKQPPQPPEIMQTQPNDVITQIREYQLITPLYGGGVAPNEADPVTVIRATEIRGHLRFWWRACRGGQKKFDADPAKMKEEEDAIWGAAYKKNSTAIAQEQTIQIVIEAEPLEKDLGVKPYAVKPYLVERGRPRSINGIPGYAAFPLQPDKDELQERNPYIPDVIKDVSFTMTISFPSNRSKDIEAALWAWETFGGIGARTRRGFGALSLLKVNRVDYADLPSSSSVKQWLSNKLNHPNIVEPGLFPTQVPHLSGNTLFAIVSSGSPTSVWHALINKLRDFRQAKNENRSAWPEAKAIRTILAQQDEKVSSTQTFPRAAFGLPIIFHFTGDDAPLDTELKEKGEGKDRFASPLILRPLLCSDNRAVGVALLLEGSRIDAQNLSLVEQDRDKKAHSVRATLNEEETSSITILKGETNVLQAFMNSLKGVR